MIKPTTGCARSKTQRSVSVKRARKLRNKTKKNHQQKMHGGNNNPINLRELKGVLEMDITNIGQFVMKQNDDIYLYPVEEPNSELKPIYIAPNEAGRTKNYDNPTRLLTIRYPANQDKNALTLLIKINGYEA